jgi:hypothetical protein
MLKTEINKLPNFFNKNLIIGASIYESIDDFVFNLYIDKFIWEDNQRLLFLQEDGNVLSKFDKIKNILSEMNLSYSLNMEEGYVQCENNVLSILSIQDSNRAIEATENYFTHTYLHFVTTQDVYVNNIEVFFYISKYIWVSTIDVPESIFYEPNILPENKIIVTSEQSRKTIKDYRNNPYLHNLNLDSEILGDFQP